jgi:hypothetical protein
MPPIRRGRHRPVASRLERRFIQRAPIVEELEPEPTDALSWFWAAVEAESIDRVLELWPDFEKRSRESRAIANREGIADTLWHLGRALDQNPVFNDWAMRGKRQILKAIKCN